MFINEVTNDVAQKAVDVACNYLRKNQNLGLNVYLTVVEGNRTDGKGLREEFCNKYERLIKEKKPPHVIIDATKTGDSSDTIKMISAELAIPTVSASFGDLSIWSDISDKKKNYLLQVLPPADIFPEIIRSIVIYKNMTNAAIFYDTTFILDNRSKTLFENTTMMKHEIMPITSSKPAINEQLIKLKNSKINNYFILGTIKSIQSVLGEYQP